MLVAALAALALGAATPQAAAKPSCGRQIIDDWVDDNRIDGTYPLHCYGEATAAVPEDLAVYTGILEDIASARQRASRLRRLTVNPTPTTRTASTPSRGVFKQALDKLGSRNVDTVPLPLLILAALSLLLIGAGAAGLVSRRLRARKVPG
ncbi:MAG: hypothetical protein AABM30_04900 [Actinomycetota bacterium]